MKFAVIAAGEGSRLHEEGVPTPKPLVRAGAERLVDRLLRIFQANGAREIVVVCNSRQPEVAAHLRQKAAQGIPLRVVEQSTPSSMHSLQAMAPWLADGPFCLTTVDTVFSEAAFAAYVEAFRQAVESGADGLMGVTPYVDDEKPLYVETDGQMQVTAFLDRPTNTSTYVSAGIYGLTPRCLQTLERCVARGEMRMRNFQRALVADGLRLQAWSLGTVMDIDHAADLAKAERFLAEN